MGQQERADLARRARENVSTAESTIGSALIEPGPGAGGIVLIAVPLLVTASQQLAQVAAQSIGEPGLWTSLSADAGARAVEAGAVAAIPWPFVYVGIAFLLRAVSALHAAIPGIVVLEPVLRKGMHDAQGVSVSDEYRQALIRLGMPVEFFASALAHGGTSHGGGSAP